MILDAVRSARKYKRILTASTGEVTVPWYEVCRDPSGPVFPGPHNMGSPGWYSAGVPHETFAPTFGPYDWRNCGEVSDWEIDTVSAQRSGVDNLSYVVGVDDVMTIPIPFIQWDTWTFTANPGVLTIPANGIYRATLNLRVLWDIISGFTTLQFSVRSVVDHRKILSFNELRDVALTGAGVDVLRTSLFQGYEGEQFEVVLQASGSACTLTINASSDLFGFGLEAIELL